MVFEFSQSGSFNNLEKFLKAMTKLSIRDLAKMQAKRGVVALRAATPRESGLAASSWYYEIIQNGTSVRIVWKNSDIETGFNVAIALQYGYSTGTGGYVQGRDYINPAMRPVFESIADEVWKAVTSA